MPTQTRNRSTAISLLILAAVVFYVLTLIPYGRWVQWPFVILTTFIHEMGHGLTGLLVGGSFIKIELFSNASGVAYTSTNGDDWRQAAVAAGGLLAPSVFGGLLIFAGRSARASSHAFLALSIVIIVSCAVWVRSLFGLSIMLPMGLIFLWLSRKSSQGVHHFLIQFIGVHMLVDTLTRTMRYLFKSSASVNGSVGHSDTGSIAANLGGPYWFWGALIALIAVSIFFISIRRAYYK